MERSEQFALFHRYFDSENERFESLTRRATIYLSVISGLSIFAGLKLDDFHKLIPTHPLTITLAAVSGLFVLMCLAATVMSLRVYPYKDVCDIETLTVEIEERDYSTEDVYSILLANLADATKVNRSINDRRAHYLEWSAAFLGLAVASFILNNIAVVSLFR